MDNDKFLFITDSQAKSKTLSKVLDELGIFFDVLVIENRLLKDYDPHEIISLNRYFPDVARHHIPNMASLISQVKDAIDHYSYILICTESNEIGDLIALDIFDILNFSNKVLRCDVEAFDIKNVDLAMETSSHFESISYQSSVISKVIDNSISSLNQHGYANKGLLQCALLGAVKIGGIPYKKITLCLESNDNNGPFYSEQMVSRDNESKFYDFLSELNKLPSCDVEEFYLSPISQPWDLVDCIVNISERLKCTGNDVYKEMVSLYENGAITRINTDAKGINNAAISHLKHIAERSGIKINGSIHSSECVGLFDEKIIKPIGSTNFGESPRPLVNGIDIITPIKLLSFNDAVLSLITRNLILSGINTIIDKPDISNLPHWAKKMNWRRERKQSLPWMDPVKKPGIHKIDKTCSILLALKKNNIGQPYQFIKSAIDILNDGVVDEKLNLTTKGLKMHDMTSPELVDPTNYRKFREIIKENQYIDGQINAISLLKVFGNSVCDQVLKSVNSGASE